MARSRRCRVGPGGRHRIQLPLNADGTPEPWFTYQGKQATVDYQRATLARFSRIHMVGPEYTHSPDGKLHSPGSQAFPSDNGVSDPLRDGLRAIFAHYTAHGFHGGSSLALRAILGRAHRSLDDFFAGLAR